MKNVWLVYGAGQQYFCFNRDGVGAAISRILGLIGTGDSIVDGPSLDRLDEILQHFNDERNWMDQRTVWKWTRNSDPVIEALVVDPKAMATALCEVGRQWLL